MTLTAHQSLQGRFALVYSGDPALQPRPADLPDDTAADVRAERTAAQAKHDHALTVARDTGNWTPLIIPGTTPTLFSFELPLGSKRRKLIDLYQRHDRADEHASASAALFRATCKDATSLPEGAPTLTFVVEGGISMLADDVVDFLDGRVGPYLIGEFAETIYERLLRFPGKS